MGIKVKIQESRQQQTLFLWDTKRDNVLKRDLKVIAFDPEKFIVKVQF